MLFADIAAYKIHQNVKELYCWLCSVVSWCLVTPNFTLPSSLAVQCQKRHFPAPNVRKVHCREELLFLFEIFATFAWPHSSPNTPFPKESFYLGNYARLGALCRTFLSLFLSVTCSLLSVSVCWGSGRCMRKWRLHLAKVKGKEACYTLTGTSLLCLMTEHSRAGCPQGTLLIQIQGTLVILPKFLLKSQSHVYVGFKCLCIHSER